jgi:hypothetical protein
VDNRLAAEKIRARLENRLATFLACEIKDLPRMKIGTLIHTLFLLLGDAEELGGFHASMSGVLQIVGHEVVWDIDPKIEDEKEKAQVIH